MTHGLNIAHLLETEWGVLSEGKRTKVALAELLMICTPKVGLKI